ncbi:MAG TPA: hypothetical protein VH374_15835 [Polyangia bacterium]|nr:hypothetical protein [Polyangia bacterium]
MDNRRPQLAKRMKEMVRQQKQKEKAERKAQRQRDKNDRGGEEVEDPDIAGIVPGPQPVAEE